MVFNPVDLFQRQKTRLSDMQYIMPGKATFFSYSKIQLGLMGLIATLSVTCFALVMVLGLHHGGVIPIGKRALSDICTTSQCLTTVVTISANMNNTVDPCDNFYEYACGGFHTRRALAPDQYVVSIRQDMNERQEERLRELIEAPIVRQGSSSSERKMKDFFKSCTHDYGRRKDAGKPLLELVKKHLKGWYVLDPVGWKNNGWTLRGAMQALHSKLDVSALFSLQVRRDWRTRESLITIDYNRFGMPSWWIQNGYRVDAYKKSMKDMATLLLRDANVSLNASEIDTRLEQFVNDSYAQERDMALMVRNSRSSSRYYYYRNPYKVAPLYELEHNFTQIPWRSVIQSAYEGYDISPNTKIRIKSINYLTALDQLLRNEADSKDRILNNYFVWQMMVHYAPYLSFEYRYLQFRFKNQVYGTRSLRPTWEECTDQVKERLGVALGAAYVQTHIGEGAMDKVVTMYNTVLNKTLEVLLQLDWMDNRTKLVAEEKVRGITSTLGLPKHYFESITVDSLHSKLIINRSATYLENLLNVNKFVTYLQAMELKMGQSENMWQFTDMSWGFGVSSYFSTWRNHFMLPAGALQAPLYQRWAPGAYNYGALGTQMGTYLVRSYDNRGRYTTPNGQYRDWWRLSTQGGYLKAYSCFADYFSNYTLGPFNVYGRPRTVKINSKWQIEGVIDGVAGLKAGFAAYRRNMNNQEQRLPGLNLTSDQAFFFSYAQSQCKIQSDSYAYGSASWGRIPPKYRVNAELSHVPAFADAFQCKKESKMVATDTCVVH